MKKMSALFLSLLLFTLPASFVSMTARADDQQSEVETTESFNWIGIKRLVSGCAVQPVAKLPSGRSRFLPIVSLCPEVLSVTGTIAQFRLQDSRFTAVLLESPLADSGDLNTLIIRDTEGQIVAKAEHIAAFGDILLALAGGQNVFRQISVDPLHP